MGGAGDKQVLRAELGAPSALGANPGSNPGQLPEERTEMLRLPAATTTTTAAAAALVLLCSLAGASSPPPKLSGVITTTGKDTRVFEKSIHSALTYLLDVDQYYVISPQAKELSGLFSSRIGHRVHFVEESRFPFTWQNISTIMMDTVKEHGKYPLSNGESPFEKLFWNGGKVGWYYQQILKLYAGEVLGIDDYVILDSDLIWMQNVSFISPNQSASASTTGVYTYQYATSWQYYPSYHATSKKIMGLEMYKEPGKGKRFKSGIVHHMTISKPVLRSLMDTTLRLHGLPLWHVMLNASALEITCRAPRNGICGNGGVLSEYELYFSFARSKFPDSVQLRPLLWTNGPAPGLLFEPKLEDGLASDGPKSVWTAYRREYVQEAFEKQIAADVLQGYAFVGYHAYAKRRYFELWDEDIDSACVGAPDPAARNSTCAYNGFNAAVKARGSEAVGSLADYLRGCACFMARHPSGP